MHRALPRGTFMLSALASILALSKLAGAQPAPKPAAPPPASAPPAQPPAAIEVNDPLLAPVPPAPHVLHNWREAITLIMARSVDLAIAVQEVERSEGLARQALALALPTLTATGTVTGQLVTGQIGAS